MIAKHISSASLDSFRALALYIAAAEEEGEKLGDFWAMNCRIGNGIEDLDLLIAEIQATQALNSQARPDRSFHLMLSFRDERPPTEDLVGIERQFADGLGLGEHQRLAATHLNTECFHMHIAYNLIHPRKYTMNIPWRSYPRLEKVSRNVEAEYGLKVDRGHSDTLGRPRIPDRARAKEVHSWEQSFASYTLELLPRLDSARAIAKTWQELHVWFAKFGILIEPRARGLVLRNAGDGAHYTKASTLGRKFGKPGLEEKFGAFEAARADLRVEAIRSYGPRPVTRHNGQAKLWEEYQAGKRGGASPGNRIYGTWREFVEAEAHADPIAKEIIEVHRRHTREASLERGMSL